MDVLIFFKCMHFFACTFINRTLVLDIAFYSCFKRQFYSNVRAIYKTNTKNKTSMSPRGLMITHKLISNINRNISLTVSDIVFVTFVCFGVSVMEGS